MKKIILTALAICTLSVGLAQEEDLTDSQERMEKFNEVKKHEISLDVAAAIGGLGINP
jgi:purine-nucleoside phosphorylase